MNKYIYTLVLLISTAFAHAQDPAYPPAPAAPQNIIAAESFTDTDPGEGNGTPISVSAAVNISSAAASVNVSGLSNGIHRLYIRTRNNEGSWSITHIRDFLYNFDIVYLPAPAAPQNIIAAEYFIDTDPGFGSGTAITITPGVDIAGIPVTVNTGGLSNGTHRLFLRTKSNEGRWSIGYEKDFVINFDFNYPASPAAPQNIIAAEYFIDTDPGFGSGQAISISAGVDIANIAAVINTSGLSTGVHRFFLRSKNNEGSWGITNEKDFIVNSDFSYPAAPAAAQNIIAAEYFIDADPGFGSATPIAVTAGVNLSNIAAIINTAGLSNGNHTLFIRTKNNEGTWSITNTASFFTNLLAVSPDTISFGNVPLAVPVTKNLIVTNNSATTQTINSIIIRAPFAAINSTPATIAAGKSDTLQISFTAAAATTYSDSVTLQTSAGNYTVKLNGTGIVQQPSWTIDPATGHDYGNVAVNGSANFNFTIRNTGNIDIVLNNVILSDPAFTPTYSAGTVVPVNGSVNLPVSFTPTAVGSYSAQLKIKSGTTGADSVTTVVNGNGYTPGTAPVLQFVNAAPYNGITGVNPAAGQTGLYTYKILYKSAGNRPPQTNYPKVGIDLNGDGDFNDLGEGLFNMVKEGTSTDYITGVVYSYTFTHTSNTNTAGYQFFGIDDNGNTATTVNTAYKAGPIITDQQLDLKIFASDISFSKTNPLPGETFTVTATITNSTAIPAVNVPIKFYRDTILIASGVLPAVNAFSSSNISQTLNFSAEGYFPIKVWIDSSNTLGESNILNNYAIRPVIVGSPSLPGGITVTTSAKAQSCPQLKVLISGTAVYFGTGSATAVAGAQVSINTGTQFVTTTTDANGNYSYLLSGVTCGNNFAYTVSITDFTFTSNTLTNSIPLPCPPANACTVTPSQGGVITSFSNSECANVVDGSANVNVILQYRARNPYNMWSSWDQITNVTLKIFRDGVLINTITPADGTVSPGDVVTLPFSLALNSTTPVLVSATLTYTYVEFFQIPTTLYTGQRTAMSASGSATIQPQPNLPDLTIQQFTQTGFTAFNFQDANIQCGPAGPHLVKVFDSIPGGTSTLIQTTNIASLTGHEAAVISFSNPALAPGIHILTIVTDPDNAVTETDETNNGFITSITVPQSDLSVTAIQTSATDLSVGSPVQFIATIKNTGKQAGNFHVQFLVNGVQAGSKIIAAGIAERDSIKVTSDVYTVASAINTCGETIEVIADADNEISESDETNNSRQVSLSADLSPFQLSTEDGSAARPVVVRVNTSNQFFPAIRNFGLRDASNVTISYTLNGSSIGWDTVTNVKAGIVFAAHSSFTHMFTVPGDYVVTVKADTGNTICESDETNNSGDFHIHVTDSKPDFEVLSQYISPSSLNPNAGQNITIVGTVRNSGGKPTTANVLRFLVDDIQLGNDVPINALAPGTDTTVAATATYSSLIAGVKIMKLIADPDSTLDEEREDNNIATRALIVGDAPDMARQHAGAISFNPTGFRKGDSVLVSYAITNNGVQGGTAWARFLILDNMNTVTAIDSVQFTLAAGANMIVSRMMKFDNNKGTVITEIVNCSPAEFDLLNNNDTLAYTTIMSLRNNIVIPGDMDLQQGLPSDLPGWIGGKLLLGDFDLTINGSLIHYDTSHFIVTNGSGRLKLVNNKASNIFPVAASLNSLNFVNINNTGVPDNFSVRVVPYVLQHGDNGDTITNDYVNRTWFVEEETPGGSNATITFSWNVEDEQVGFFRRVSRVAHYTGIWELGDIGIADTDSTGRFSRTQSGYSSFSPFTVNSVNNALPLQLLQFTAAAKENTVLLNWQTSNEINTSRFVIQHSFTGTQFTDVGTVTANNSSGINNYSFVHQPVNEGVHYYRLKMIDADGNFTYSLIRIVSVTAGNLMQLYPNPANRFINVRGLQADGILQIMTTDGKLVKQYQTSSGSMLINLEGLTGGMYIMVYKNKDAVQQQKFMKE